jgi:hypothetical protein
MDYWAFNSEADLQRTFDAIRGFERRKALENASKPISSKAGIYVKITELISGSDDKEAKAEEVEWDDATKAFITPANDPIQYDNDSLDSEGATIFTTTNVSAENALSVDDIKLIIPYPNASETSDWLVVETGGGSTLINAQIVSKLSGTQYTVDLLDNRRDKNITTVGNGTHILWLDNAPAVDLGVGDIYSAEKISSPNGSNNTYYQTVGSLFLRN